MVSFLVLDYQRPQELALCLESIKRNAHFDYKVVVLVNGGDSKAAELMYKRGYIDKLVLNRENTGGGFGTTKLVSECDTEYAFYVQEDQFLARPFFEPELLAMQDYMHNQDCKVIGLAGDQCNGNYSERAQLLNVEWYNAFMLQAPNGGPGPFHHLMHNEEYIQTAFKKLNLEFKIWQPAYFADNGKRSFREYPCGGKTLHYTDTKELFVIVPPKQKYVFPHLTDTEWETVIAGKWQDGMIPEQDKPHSFLVWPQ